MSDKPKLRTRCYYTEYVNHMIRFYLTTPDTLPLDETKRGADIANWLAVQTVFRSLNDEHRNLVLDIYRTDYRIPKAVEQYCQEKGVDQYGVWKVLTKVLSLIARQRGLI